MAWASSCSADEVPPGLAHFAPKAKRVIYLHMVGGPSQLDLYDYKPKMAEMYDKDLPESIRNGQRLTTMTSGQARFPVAPSKYKFAQHGKSGMWVSELLPGPSKMVDDLCFIRSDETDAINHEPAITACRPATRSPAALHRLVGVVRPRLDEPQPADVRGASRQAQQHRADPGDLRAAVVRGLPAGRARGRRRSAAAATRSCTSTTRPASPPTSAAATSTGSRPSTR